MLILSPVLNRFYILRNILMATAFDSPCGGCGGQASFSLACRGGKSKSYCGDLSPDKLVVEGSLNQIMA